MQSTRNIDQSLYQTPLSFKFKLTSSSAPGVRWWYREGNVWHEKYPNDKEDIFQNVSHGFENKTYGSVITKKDGSQVFIPDFNKKNTEPLRIYYRKCVNSNWFPIGDMEDIKLEASTSNLATPRRVSSGHEKVKMHPVAREEETDLAPLVKEVAPYVPHLFQWLIDGHNERKAQRAIDRQQAQAELQRKKELLEQERMNKQDEEKSRKEVPPQKNVKQEPEQQEAKEISKNPINLQENIKKYTDFLDILDLTKYQSYEECERQMKEVRDYDMSNELKKNLFDKIRDKQQPLQKSLPVLAALQPKLFDKPKSGTVDEAKKIAEFKDRLNFLSIDTVQDYETFKEDDFYTHCGLTEYTKDRLFRVHQADNKKNAALASLDLGLSSKIDDSRKDDFLPRL